MPVCERGCRCHLTISFLFDMLNSLLTKVAYTWAFVFGVHVPVLSGNKKQIHNLMINGLFSCANKNAARRVSVEA